MPSFYQVASLFLWLAVIQSVCECNQECVWVEGQLLCNRNQTWVINSTVTIFDRDGKSIFNVIDPDDKMGTTVVLDRDGKFRVEGCGNDRDWLPMILNKPEPYIVVHHYCVDRVKGTEMRLPEFNVFMPDVYRIHEIHLDE